MSESDSHYKYRQLKDYISAAENNGLNGVVPVFRSNVRLRHDTLVCTYQVTLPIEEGNALRVQVYTEEGPIGDPIEIFKGPRLEDHCVNEITA